MKDSCKITKALHALKGPGNFYHLWVSDIDKVTLYIKNQPKFLTAQHCVTQVNFPIDNDTSIPYLLSSSVESKFGLKDETLLDKNVRNSLEISSDKIFTCCSFADYFNSDYDDIMKEDGIGGFLEGVHFQLSERGKSELGLQEDDYIETSMHNLLIYQKGSFFKPHQDTVKEDGMFGTLVVILPSDCEGGYLKLDNHGDKVTIKPDKDKVTFVAFYADVHHEVTKVTKGNRFALTYNLILKSSTDIESVETLYPKEFNDLYETVEEYFSERNSSMIYLLDHQYNQDNLNFKGLKLNDRYRAKALKEIAEKLDLEFDMMLCNSERHSDAYNPSNKYDSEDTYNTADDDCGQRRPIENPDISKLSIEGFEYEYGCELPITKEIRGIKCSDKSFFYCNRWGREEIFFTKSSDKFNPFKTIYEPYMGNWGNELTKWYHRAAVILRIK